MSIKKAAAWAGTLIFLLVMGWLGADRIDLLLNSNVEDAVVVSCDGKAPRRHVGPRGRTRSWTYAPVAVTTSGVKVKGSLSLSRKAWCEHLIGSKTTILVHTADVTKSRYNSYLQFWLMPAFFLTLAVCFLAMNNRIVWTSAFASFCVLSTGALALEFQLFGGTTVSQSMRSDIALTQCITKSMAAEGVTSRRALKKLVCVNLGITDIAELNQFESLEELYLQSNDLSSLKPLRPLKHLRILSVTKNRKLTSLEGLEDLHSMEILRAHSMQIRDISALRDMKKLRVLSLGRNKIKDISALANLDQLEELLMAHNPVSDISPLTGKPNLRIAVFYGSPISDIRPLFNNHALKTVGIRGKSTVPCEQFEKIRTHLSADAKVFGETSCG